MRKLFSEVSAHTVLIGVTIGLMSMSGCSTQPSPPVAASESLDTASVHTAPQNPTAKARIVIARFKDKTGRGYHWWNPDIGDEMARQLSEALQESGRFILPALTSSNNREANTLEEPDLMLLVSVTEFSNNTSQSSQHPGNVLDALSHTVNTARITLDLRLLETRTARLIHQAQRHSKSDALDLEGAIDDYLSGGKLAGALTKWQDTATEQALRDVTRQTVQFVIDHTPKHYYYAKRPTSKVTPPSFVTVTAQQLNIRNEASLQANIVQLAYQGEHLRTLEQDGQWLRVKTATGISGWVARWLTTPGPAPGNTDHNLTQTVAEVLLPE